MKKIIFTTFLAALIGFACGVFVDSFLFHINPFFCGAIEGVLLGGIQCAFALKDSRA